MSIKKFRIVLDGVAHEVEVEDLGKAAASSAPAVPVSAPVSAPAAPAAPVAPAEPAPKAAPSAPPAEGGEVVGTPLQGTVQSILVSVGQRVEADEVIAIVEAMKMQNEIVAPRAGVVSAIHVEKGAVVAYDDPLISLQ